MRFKSSIKYHRPSVPFPNQANAQRSTFPPTSLWEIGKVILRLIYPSGCFKTGMIQSNRNKWFLLLYYYLFLIDGARGWEADQEFWHGTDLKELRHLSTSLESGGYCREKYSKNKQKRWSNFLRRQIMRTGGVLRCLSAWIRQFSLSWRTHIWKFLLDNSTPMNPLGPCHQPSLYWPVKNFWK